MDLSDNWRDLKRNSFRAVYPLIFIVALSGCDLIKNSNLMDNLKRAPSPLESNDISERGFGKLSKGKFLAAQALFDEALKNNPRDVYALFGKGIVLQHSGELNHARQVFEAVLAMRPSSDQKLLVINDLAPQTVRELAALNLSLLDSKGVSSAFGAPGKPGAPSQNKTFSRSELSAPILPRRMVTPSVPIIPGITSEDKNIISRFETLKKLSDQGLLTPVEYTLRRKRNLGALTKLTARPAAAGLARSVPSAEQISRRLKAIGRALELRAITIRQHGAERRMIIDGLMPANPKLSASPSMAPKGLMAAAAAVRRVEMLKERGLISEAEYTKEKSAIEKILAPTAPVAAKLPAKGPKASLPVLTSKGGPRPALHLASFRSEKSANRAWLQLRRAHRSVLGKMKPEVMRVNLGRTKGVYYRLIVGPFTSSTAAAQACKKLKSRRQYCDAAFMGAP
jgi:tetratricopeptide (TPR) repeat protein